MGGNAPFYLHKVSRAEISGLKIFEIGEKYYFEDLGLRNAIRGFNASDDIHKLMENAVYLFLRQNGFTVYVGKLGDKEIDFMAEKEGKKIYIQVALTAMQEETRKREFGNLMQVEDNYPKYVITLGDIIVGNDYKGIQYMNLKDFLILEL